MRYEEFKEKVLRPSPQMPEVMSMAFYEIYMKGLSEGYECVYDSEKARETLQIICEYYE